MTRRFFASLAVLAFIVLIPLTAFAEGIAVISGSSFPKDSLSASDVKDIYLGKTALISGVKVKPLDQKAGLKSDFLQKAVGMSEDDYKGYWIKRVFREGGNPPAVKTAADDIVSAVKDEAGSIGYISESEAKSKGGIKVLLVLK